MAAVAAAPTQQSDVASSTLLPPQPITVEAQCADPYLDGAPYVPTLGFPIHLGPQGEHGPLETYELEPPVHDGALEQFVLASLGDDVDLILDGGACRLGLESTILDLTRDPPEILRHGGVTDEALSAVVGPLALDTVDGGGPRSPGRLRRHYATRLALRTGATELRPGPRPRP